MTEQAPLTVAESVGKFVFVFAWIFAVVVLYVFLGDKAFGIQIATMVVYSGSVFCLVFFRWRGLEEAYSLRNKVVQAAIPRLLVIHFVFLAFVVAALTLAFSVQPRLPSYWVTERFARGGSFLSRGLLVMFTLAGLAQVLICRRILSRRVGERIGGDVC